LDPNHVHKAQGPGQLNENVDVAAGAEIPVYEGSKKPSPSRPMLDEDGDHELRDLLDSRTGTPRWHEKDPFTGRRTAGMLQARLSHGPAAPYGFGRNAAFPRLDASEAQVPFASSMFRGKASPEPQHLIAALDQNRNHADRAGTREALARKLDSGSV
jgi:hypothetical protein